jgi:predicted CopG family antitoxin
LKVIKISDNVYEKLKELAEKRGLSLNQLVEEILNVYLGGESDRAIKRIVSMDLINEYEGKKCKKCGKQLAVGEQIHYIKYEYHDGSVKVIYYCLDCWYSTSALAKKYLKMKELEATIRGLKREADKLVEQIKMYQQQLEEIKIQLDVRQSLAKIREELEFLLSRELISVKDFKDAMSKIEELLLKLEELEKATRPFTFKSLEEIRVKERVRIARS